MTTNHNFMFMSWPYENTLYCISKVILPYVLSVRDIATYIAYTLYTSGGVVVQSIRNIHYLDCTDKIMKRHTV